MTSTAAVGRIVELPEVAEGVRQAREACAGLRWHPALRRRGEEARAEATIRAARCSAALEGARYPTSALRRVPSARIDRAAERRIF